VGGLRRWHCRRRGSPRARLHRGGFPSFAHRGDLGIYNVGTDERARRRGLATALTARLVNEAVGLGCTTVTLQSTPMAERLYAACGFRPVARILEYVPG